MKSPPRVNPWEAAGEDQGKNGQANQEVHVLPAERVPLEETNSGFTRWVIPKVLFPARLSH